MTAWSGEICHQLNLFASERLVRKTTDQGCAVIERLLSPDECCQIAGRGEERPAPASVLLLHRQSAWDRQPPPDTITRMLALLCGPQAASVPAGKI